VLALGVLLLFGSARADILIIRNQGHTPMPVRHTGVSMDAETVVVDEAKVTATFRMRSHSSNPIRETMAFPILVPQWGPAMEHSFVAELRSGAVPNAPFVQVPVKLQMDRKGTWEDEAYPPESGSGLDYPGYLTWEVEWAPHETKTVRCSYDMGRARPYTGLVHGWAVHYVARTGALWKGGVIGEADFRIRVNGHVGPKSGKLPRPAPGPEPAMVTATSYPDVAEWKSANEVQWHFENWTPTDDIWVKFGSWRGLDAPHPAEYPFRLPRQYLGATNKYTDAYLDELVERELEPFRSLFPQHCKAFERPKLKRVIADWLSHEILARHGDPFFVGRGSLGGNPEAVLGIGDNLYGRWHYVFQAYMYHGGWYRPRMGPGGAVDPKALSPLEQQNLAFLATRLK
jgi:hypothetical protein